VLVVVLPKGGGVKELRGAQQTGHAPMSGTEVKNGRSSAKDGDAQMQDNPEGELDPADDVHRRCMKNYILRFYPA